MAVLIYSSLLVCGSSDVVVSSDVCVGLFKLILPREGFSNKGSNDP